MFKNLNSFWKQSDILKINHKIKNINQSNDDLVISFVDEIIPEIILFHFKLKMNISDIHFYYSNDNLNYKLLDYSLLNVESNKVELELFQKYSFSFLKLVNFNSSLLDSIDLYIRKHPGLILSCRYDGFASRIFSIINALYISKKTKLKFGFIWPVQNFIAKHNISNNHIAIDDAENIFELNFVSKYVYPTSLQQNLFSNSTSLKSIKDVDYSIMPKKYGHFMDYWGDLQQIIADVDYEDYILEFPKLWSEIKFSERYKSIISYINSIIELKFKNNNIMAIHLRNGDSLFDFTDFFFKANLYHYIFPIELALYIADEFVKKGYKVIFFAGDIESIKQVKQNYYNNENIYFSVDFYRDEYSYAERDFFDLILMSHADIIFGTSSSMYKVLAARIGKKSELQNLNFINIEERYDLLKNRIDIYKTNAFFKGISHAFLYLYSQQLNVNLEQTLFYLKKASFFTKNFCFELELIKQYLIQNDCCSANERLKILKDENRFNGFIDFIFIEKIGHNFKEEQILFLNFFGFGFFYIDYVCIHIINRNLVKWRDYIQIKENNNFIKFNISIKKRIHNHLSYKLGQALIDNSKSILGYIRMPYVLSYIKDKHKFEQKAYEEKIKQNPNLALPPLETYPDYNEALKEKECFTYKLGEAFIKASKNWYKGGYIKFIFKDVPRLKMKIKQERRNNNGNRI
ncbi:hypothetical protein ACQ9UK_000658 [Campylobacter jejuni]|uniref:CMP-N-acetylneuraminate-beta-galactosamide-alpha-2,3-sialyltransferase n=1 Tax=Campylobacter jejuni subsp. jejuni TaxID=32022 RepID=A0A0S2CFS4_CAMJU|nr:hypothetical protein [Campylobacter jejuni]ALN43993.1 CMP-N-acetylneuraminate-beta-galactosamide- alpha-2,3-sialyltransferase [Campylobacter jejuni subsp. jejuni]KAJ9723399.1 hypothetical protein QR327_04480 [Campylobacter jejuni]MEA8964380.1 hypothetical protein [Campylobacter jejuni]MEA8973204.1 hypothetical protein [Campylobacter jejuni]